MLELGADQPGRERLQEWLADAWVDGGGLGPDDARRVAGELRGERGDRDRLDPPARWRLVVEDARRRAHRPLLRAARGPERRRRGVVEEDAAVEQLELVLEDARVPAFEALLTLLAAHGAPGDGDPLGPADARVQPRQAQVALVAGDRRALAGDERGVQQGSGVAVDGGDDDPQREPGHRRGQPGAAGAGEQRADEAGDDARALVAVRASIRPARRGRWRLRPAHRRHGGAFGGRSRPVVGLGGGADSLRRERRRLLDRLPGHRRRAARHRVRARLGVLVPAWVGMAGPGLVLPPARVDGAADPVRQARHGAVGPRARDRVARGAHGRRARGDGRRRAPSARPWWGCPRAGRCARCSPPRTRTARWRSSRSAPTRGATGRRITRSAVAPSRTAGCGRRPSSGGASRPSASSPSGRRRSRPTRRRSSGTRRTSCAARARPRWPRSPT